MKKKEAAEAYGLHKQMKLFNVVMLLVFDNIYIYNNVIVCLDDISSLTNCLSIKLQSANLDFGSCAKLVKATKEELISYRNEEHFTKLYNESVDLANESNVQLPCSNLCNISNQRKPTKASNLTDFYVTSTLGARNQLNSNNDKNELRISYFDILDNIISVMDKRFEVNSDLINCVNLKQDL